MEYLANFSRGEKCMLTETFIGTFSFIARWEKSVSGMPLKRTFFSFLRTACFSEALKWRLLLWPSGSADAHRERSRGADATVQNACSRRPDPKFGEAKRSLAPDLTACWTGPRESTSEQPVPLAPGTEGKLRTHKVALRYGCKKPRNNHVRGHFKKW